MIVICYLLYFTVLRMLEVETEESQKDSVIDDCNMLFTLFYSVKNVGGGDRGEPERFCVWRRGL